MGRWTWATAPVLLSISGLMACTIPEPAPPAPEVVDPISAHPATLLPALSPEALQQREAELTDRIDSELALAGIGKIINLGEPISSELETFRLAWAESDPAIAPFLGTWVKDWDLMPYDFVTVLPSTVPGQVCLVRYRQSETETVPFETFTTPPEFSVALVVDGQLLSQDVQTAATLIRPTPASAYVPYAIEFLGMVEAEGELRLLAAQQPPTIDPAWETSLVEQIDTYGCSASAPS
ncbi:hypothetical protein VB780_12040 [Leptolyngbya sp. CCNP1308]|uniref:hypothetical protein n=1 Tax=Leptolyngbya sp. CCNP1308 TaxID=3110255 RepID=UPI002B1F81F0|nr:hypothetical protein [Leptolyngbya sp. CCNP1308]MEA5449304.1 hypothetical protein [Leptolyngbya sp. CCNP1308]